MKIAIFLLFLSSFAQADVTRYYDACGFVGMRIGQDIFSAEYIKDGLSEEHASKVMAEIALIKLGQSNIYEVDLTVFYPELRCS